MIYDSLGTIHRSFEQILPEFQRLHQIEGVRGRPPIKSVELAIRETRAWAMFEMLDVLHQHEEREWTRLGRVRSRQEGVREISRSAVTGEETKAKRIRRR